VSKKKAKSELKRAEQASRTGKGKMRTLAADFRDNALKFAAKKRRRANEMAFLPRQD